MELRISGGYVRDAAFLAFGCPAVMSAASAACARLRGASLLDAMRLSIADIDSDLGGLSDEHRHGPDLVVDALARALEQWYSACLGIQGLPRLGNRVAVAMSGGVDSAVAAMLLVREGYDVVGVTMRLWHDPLAAAAERSCCSPETVRLARASAHHLGIPHLTLDVAETFRREVVEAFIRGYQAGETPNPCVTCNGSVRFRGLDLLLWGQYIHRTMATPDRFSLPQIAETTRKPDWLKVKLPLGGNYRETKALLSD